MNIQDLNELDLNNIGSWPLPIKAVLILILCVGIGFGYYKMHTEDQLAKLEKEQKAEVKLRKTFETKQASVQQPVVQHNEVIGLTHAMVREQDDEGFLVGML